MHKSSFLFFSLDCFALVSIYLKYHSPLAFSLEKINFAELRNKKLTWLTKQCKAKTVSTFSDGLKVPGYARERKPSRGSKLLVHHINNASNCSNWLVMQRSKKRGRKERRGRRKVVSRWMFQILFDP
jgi:hypothetical protein